MEFFFLYLCDKLTPMNKIYLNGDVYEVNFDSNDVNKGVINGHDFELDIVQRNDSQYHLIKDDKSYCIDVLQVDYDTKEIRLKINGQIYEGRVENDLDILLKKMGIENKSKSANNELRAPMPGMVLSVNIEKGQKITNGDTLVVLEAMKMENNLKADSNLKVKEIHCSKGDTVNKNQLLISFENDLD